MSHLSPAEIEDAAFKPHVKEAADKLLALINQHVAARVAIASVKREPLSEPQVREAESRAYQKLVAAGHNGGMVGESWDLALAREIEQAHGIGVTVVGIPITSQWLPIESAPKMTKIIAGYFNKCGKWRTITARYYVENTLQIDDDYRGDEEGYAPAGWYEESESHCENLLPVDEPLVFWMHLPPPPIKDSLTTDSGEDDWVNPFYPVPCTREDYAAFKVWLKAEREAKNA